MGAEGKGFGSWRGERCMFRPQPADRSGVTVADNQSAPHCAALVTGTTFRAAAVGVK